MKILMTGATGFIGRKLALKLFEEGHDLVVLSRDATRASRQIGFPCQALQCDLTKGPPPAAAFAGVDAIIHLAGESVAAGRWTPARKQMIRQSRVAGTRNLIHGLKAAGVKGPGIFLAASAIGYYGDRSNEALTEDSQPGSGFLAELCREWETSAIQAATPKTRVVNLRLGVVLGEGGGALAQMLPAFSIGLGARLGTGKQWMSWVHLDDVIGAFCFALKNENVTGPINVVAPESVTNTDFTRILAEALKHKARLRAPEAVLRLLLGEMADVVLSSAKVMPARLNSLGFTFAHPALREALSEVCADFPNQIFETAQFIAKPVNEVFKFFSQANNLELLTPPWLNFHIAGQSTEQIGTGTEIEYRLRLHGLPLRWKSRIEDWDNNHAFADTQVKGPYASWHHTHEFESLRDGTLVKDRVSYRLPLGQLGALVAGHFVANDVRKIFSYRTEKIREIFK